MVTRPTPQITLLWHGQVIAYRLLGRREGATIGARKGVTFVTPVLPGFPGRFRLLSPVRDGVRLRVGPGMRGKLLLRGKERPLEDLLAEPAPRRLLGGGGMFRQTELYPGDSATLELGPSDAAAPLRLLISFSDPAERVPAPRLLPDRLLVRMTATSAVLLALLLLVVRLVGDRLPDEPLQLSKERVARVTPALTPPPPQELDKRKRLKEAELAERARKQREKEAAESRRAQREEGRVGREDARAKETVIPKGREDVLRARVARTGLLAALGNQRPAGSGLAKLFDTNDRSDLETAVNGIAGAQLTAGRGNGGLGVAGTGLGGGGTGFGRIQGSGNLDVGAGRGRGRKGPALGKGREREVQVGMETGTADTSGGLTREQVNRVVRAHAAAVRYCYEKELQRQPGLSGKIELYWVIRSNGSVDRIKVASTTMGSRPVEGCIERQIRNWQFPRSDSETIVQSYPFFFRGGA